MLPPHLQTDQWRRDMEERIVQGPCYSAGLGEVQNWRLAVIALSDYNCRIAGMPPSPIPARYQSLAPRASWGAWLAKVEKEAGNG